MTAVKNSQKKEEKPATVKVVQKREKKKTATKNRTYTVPDRVGQLCPMLDKVQGNGPDPFWDTPQNQ